MKIFITAVLMVNVLLFSLCSENRTPLQQEEAASEIAPVQQALTQSVNRFGFRLLQELEREQPDSNIFISPLSVSLALGMTLNGSAGETADAIRATLGFADLSREEVNRVYRQLVRRVLEADPEVDLRIANSIWYRLGLAVLDDFLRVCRDNYAARASGLDFSRPSAVDTLNRWVKNNTNGKITRILDRIDPRMVLILLNAVYFKGTWAYQFKKEKTAEAPFHRPDGSTVSVPMMKQRGEFAYLKTARFRAVQLPYGNGRFRMLILLPEAGHTPGEILGELTPENWQQWLGQFHPDTVQVEMPRFKLKYERKLNQALSELGMGVAFRPGADFSRMVRGGGIWIDEVRHKTFLEVNEEGTEAAAVTIVTFTRSLNHTTVFRVDRPFLFLIYEEETSAILFVGKVVNPDTGN